MTNLPKIFVYKIITLLGLFVFIVVTVIPVEALAQYYSSNRRGQSSSLRRKINKLDDDKVVNVPVPILFGVTPDNISRNFGDSRSGGRSHEGLDIMAPRGAPVVTPTDAVVIRIGEGDSAGNYVYTANPGGETFAYMHLDEIAEIDEGDELDKGALIGYVGDTGNAKGGVTHLHFEIRNRNATDPYPRLTRIFPLADKMEYLEEILDNADSEKELAELMVIMYRKEFILANTLSIFVPALIQTALLTVPVSASILNSPSIPSGDLKLGSQGSLVVTLQKFLLTKNAGVNNGVVADGSFGLTTQKALAEYQASAGIKPATGYYGSITRAYIAAHP